MAGECIFCKIIKGKEKAWKVYEDEKVVAFLDAFPVNEGHVLVVTREHFRDIFDLDEDLFLHMFKIARKLSRAMKKALNAEFVNIITAPGVIKHAFLHVVPRYDYDLMGAIPDMENKRALTDEEMEIIAKKLRGALNAGRKNKQ